MHITSNRASARVQVMEIEISVVTAGQSRRSDKQPHSERGETRRTVSLEQKHTRQLFVHSSGLGRGEKNKKREDLIYLLENESVNSQKHHYLHVFSRL